MASAWDSFIKKYWNQIAAYLASLSGGGVSEKRDLKVNGKQLFYGLLAYNWSKQTPVARVQTINELVKNGWTGFAVELMERFAWWPKGDRTNDFLGDMKKKVDALVPWAEDLEKAGLWLYVVDNNSNGDENTELRNTDVLFQINDYIVKRLGGFKNVIRLPVSETDSDLRTDIRSAYIGRVEATWPDDRTSSYASRRGAARYWETHLSSMSASGPSGDVAFAVSDSGGILKELCGSVTGAKMDQTKALTWVSKMLQKSSCILYALGTGYDANIVKNVGAVGRKLGV